MNDRANDLPNDHDGGPDTDVPEVPDMTLIRCIGRGGFGHVWLATNQTTGRLRAVKLIPLRGAGRYDPAGREIVSLTHLERHLGNLHPNLLSIDHVGKTAEHLFYIMDPADDASGSGASAEPDYRPATLQHRLGDGPLPPDECLTFARELLEGLAALHEAGVVHRDVKPANCLFVDGRLKLGDFGLLTEARGDVSRIGTHTYMPPDGRMDARADVYAAGLVIYEMTTGQPAESFPQLGRRASAVAEDPILRKLNRIVLQACQPQPQQRFEDARRMLAALAAEASPSTDLRRRWIAMAWVAAVAVVVLAVLGLCFGPWRAAGDGSPVPVNFITEPAGASIHLDGELLRDEAGQPHTTPCTVPDVPAGIHRTVFKIDGLPDLDIGRRDYARVREIEASFDEP